MSSKYYCISESEVARYFLSDQDKDKYRISTCSLPRADKKEQMFGLNKNSPNSMPVKEMLNLNVA